MVFESHRRGIGREPALWVGFRNSSFHDFRRVGTLVRLQLSFSTFTLKPSATFLKFPLVPFIVHENSHSETKNLM